MQYLLDFDRTVFDMEGLYEQISIVNPEAELGTEASLAGIDLEALLFPDAVTFFSTHPKDSITVVSSGYGLTGQWDTAYQAAKIQLSNIQQYVGSINVVADSKIATIKRLAREYEDVVYVDDHPENVQDARTHIPGIHVVYINRSMKHDSASVVGSKEISTLDDLDAIIGL